MSSPHSSSTASDSSDPRADGRGRRGSVDRRHFLRLGLLGTAVASAGVMAHNPAAGAAMLQAASGPSGPPPPRCRPPAASSPSLTGSATTPSAPSGLR